MRPEKMVFKIIDDVTDRIYNVGPEHKYADILVEKDIVYDESEPKICCLDAYRLPREGKYPVVIYIHGGGFVAGDKRHRRGISRWLAASGAYVFTLNYGLGPEYSYPQAVRHLVSGVNYIASRAEELRLDLGHVVAAGDSAGGYYAALLVAAACNPKVREKADIPPIELGFSGALINCGLFDIRAAIERRLPLDLGNRIYRSFVGEYGDKVVSPVDYVNDKFPPFFVIYSQKDIFCRGQAERLISRLNECGVPVDFYASGSFVDNHCFPLSWRTRAARAANAAAEEYLARRFSDEPAPEE